jgi:hypothetical protein
MNQLQQGIIKTLCYSAVFDFPLTEKEIFKYLIYTKPVDEHKVIQEIHDLHDAGIVKKTGSYIHLPGKGATADKRIQRYQIAQQKKRRATQIAAKLISLPFVESIFLTGAVAMNNAPVDDDIDILVVSPAHSLWSARLNTTLWLDIHGLRRHPFDKRVNDKICANIFMTIQSLLIHPSKQNIYTAHEVIQTQPLIDPHGWYEQFISQNGWIVKWLPNYELPQTKNDNQSKQCAPLEWENTLYALQKWYMKSKRTREEIAIDKAFFHPRDTATIVQEKYHTLVRQYLHDDTVI